MESQVTSVRALRYWSYFICLGFGVEKLTHPLPLLGILFLKAKEIEGSRPTWLSEKKEEEQQI